jgi:universal stress protein A
MFKTVIWATDGSESADRALPYAKILAGEEGELVVVHVVQTYASALSAGLPLYADEEEVRASMQQQASDLRAEGFNATAKVVTTPTTQPAHAICDIAEQVEADLIVVGTHGHTALGSLLVGSVTQRLLHISPCPVVAVPPVRSSKSHATSATAHAVI